MKNYYKVLGVLETAEIEVIKAAYRVLAQKYHPDRWKGDSKEAHEMMSAINEAYENLSDPNKRKQHDAELKNQREKNDKESSYDDFNNQDGSTYAQSGMDEINEFNEIWKQALEYYPDINRLLKELKLYSQETAFTFQLILIETGNFKERKKIYEVVERDFLTRFFSSNIEVQEFAKNLIRSGKKKLALELNKAARIFKSNIDADLVIKKIKDIEQNEKDEKYRQWQKKQYEKQQQQQQHENETTFKDNAETSAPSYKEIFSLILIFSLIILFFLHMADTSVEVITNNPQKSEKGKAINSSDPKEIATDFFKENHGSGFKEINSFEFEINSFYINESKKLSYHLFINENEPYCMACKGKLGIALLELTDDKNTWHKVKTHLSPKEITSKMQEENISVNFFEAAKFVILPFGRCAQGYCYSGIDVFVINKDLSFSLVKTFDTFVNDSGAFGGTEKFEECKKYFENLGKNNYQSQSESLPSKKYVNDFYQFEMDVIITEISNKVMFLTDKKSIPYCNAEPVQVEKKNYFYSVNENKLYLEE